MNYGHAFICLLCCVQLCAVTAYWSQGDKPRAVLWTCYTITNVCTMFIGGSGGGNQ